MSSSEIHDDCHRKTISYGHAWFPSAIFLNLMSVFPAMVVQKKPGQAAVIVDVHVLPLINRLPLVRRSPLLALWGGVGQRATGHHWRVLRSRGQAGKKCYAIITMMPSVHDRIVTTYCNCQEKQWLIYSLR